jgi:hypothetical protein
MVVRCYEEPVTLPARLWPAEGEPCEVAVTTHAYYEEVIVPPTPEYPYARTTRGRSGRESTIEVDAARYGFKLAALQGRPLEMEMPDGRRWQCVLLSGRLSYRLWQVLLTPLEQS